MLKRLGFDVTTFDKSLQGKEKKVDVALGAALTKDVYTGVISQERDTITLISGDKDYVPVVDDLIANGCKIEVVFWHHAANELKRAASRFIDLNPHIQHFTK